MARILFTGFEEWSEADTANASRVALESLKEELTSQGHDIKIIGVDYNSVKDLLAQTDFSQYTHVISLGMNIASNAPAITFERRADNAVFDRDDDALCPTGYHGENSCAPEGETTRIVGSEALISMANNPSMMGYNIALSRHAGDFVCEYLYHGVLDRTNGTGTQALFIHLGGDDTSLHTQFLESFVSQIDTLDALGVVAEKQHETIGQSIAAATHSKSADLGTAEARK